MFFNESGNSCRDRISHLQSLSITHFLWTLSLYFGAFISVLIPAGCSSISTYEATPPASCSKVCVSSPDIRYGNTYLDILTFEDDRLERLDAYQRINDFKGDVAYIESTSGKKIIFLYMGRKPYNQEWSHINSYGGLKETRLYLKHESCDCPTLTGEFRINAGDSSGKAILKPLISEVRIAAISCDFSGTPYADSHITDLKAYLINVNSSCPLSYSTPGKPVEILNHGMLSDDDIITMTDPGTLYSFLTKHLDSSTLRPECRFLCMPNYGVEGNPGNPPTRLVLEGAINGQTYYWPINIGSQDSGDTYIIERNCCYSFDILIRRKGTTDPDIPFNLKTDDIKLRIEKWTEKKEYGIDF